MWVWVSHFKVLRQSLYVIGKDLSGELSCTGQALFHTFLISLNEAQEELLHYPGVGVDVGICKVLNFYVKDFYVMGKVLTGELSCPYDRSCWGMACSKI